MLWKENASWDFVDVILKFWGTVVFSFSLQVGLNRSELQTEDDIYGTDQALSERKLTKTT